ncbi:L10-interacting MYB domain-containing protein-like [Quillaja saponaria]|uniref:L10-interacting MYB domain-containing protein-like n=1 Tax=Quillaja saponaria TaxID=32244 RepID=A0AAD7M0I2_QUISA|nr:L10-interacting MYB domain-containing protein-like [Quillaja saponaria]
MDIEVSHEPKQERSRTRWTASLDKIFADLVVKHIQLGNRPNNVFDKKTWNHIRDEFNKQTDLNFNNNQLRKHLDVLRTRFYNLKSAYDQANDFVMDDSCYIGFDLLEDIAGQPRPETVKVKDCPIYEQLCAIFTDSAADGKYAQSSHYEELDKSIGKNAVGFASCPESGVPHSENPSSSTPMQGNASSVEKVANIMERKKKRPCEMHTTSGLNSWDQDTCNAMAEAMLEMVAASRLRAVAPSPSDDRYSITNCIKALDEIECIDQQLYFAALDLFEDPALREMFISLKSDKIRLAWLQGKYSKNSCYIR